MCLFLAWESACAHLMLARTNPLEFDDRIVLTADHRYILDGKHEAPLSVTKLIELQRSEPFDEDEIIRKNLQTWRIRASSKYHSLVRGKTDEHASLAIKAIWRATADLGTSLHAQLELLCNDEACTEPERHRVELMQFAKLRRTHHKWKPFRTELSLVGLAANGVPVVAGQLDLLARDEQGRYHIIDFKRTEKDLAPDAHGFGHTLLGRPDNPHHRYSLQCSLYALLLRKQEGINVDGMYLLQLHPDLDDGVVTTATDLRVEARRLLRELGVVGLGEVAPQSTAAGQKYVSR